MSTVAFDTLDSPRTTTSPSEAQIQLINRFMAKIAAISEARLLQAVALEDSEAFAAIASLEQPLPQPGKAVSKRVAHSEEKKRSIAVRNQIADANMRQRAFARAQERCDLLEAAEVCEILGIKKQALSQRTQDGKLLVYTEGRRRYYPAFQFEQNKVRPVFDQLIEELEIDPAKGPRMNGFIQFLLDEIDLAEPGTPAIRKARHELVDTDRRIELLKRDYRNKGSMGG
jgi:hypothetical protein